MTLTRLAGITVLVLMLSLPVSAALSCSIPDSSARFDCFPGAGVSQSSCEARGCCWLPAKQENKIELHGVPTCYFPRDYQGYNVTTIKETDYGLSALLQRSTSSGWPNDVKSLALDMWFETSQRLHFKIYDPMTARYEVPIETPPIPRQKPPMTDYNVALNSVGLIVTRKSTGAVLFDSTVAPLVYADQFIQISTSLTSDLLYGLGEHKSTLLHNASNWQRLALWARDQGPAFNTNLYGSHPFYLNIEKDGQTHGVFLLNSNAMDVDIQPMPAVTFRTIGGVLDLYIFTGPSSSNVVEQYTSVIGRAQLPPYWSLGFHLCRWGYNSAKNLSLIIERNRKLQIPYDVQWNDIDYMDRHLDWTYDQNAYNGLPDIIKDLHDYGQHYIIIVDPGISNQYPSKYKPYDVGLTKNVFIQNVTGNPLIGEVWPGTTVFPDFTNPNTTEWWYNAANEFHSIISFDGLWTDMNEPSNFVSGSETGCTKNNLDMPPYVPSIAGNGKLEYNTVCPSAKQYISSHYNLHNMYGLTEVNATNRALHKILGRRSIVISRSSYPSLGRFGGHWSGDISSTWEDLYYSIPEMLEFQFYGIPLVGADICGFGGDTTEELCTRWMQLGAFYPFMRNHNSAGQKDQDPGAFSVPTQEIIKFALEVRYSLLPFMYTQFFYSHMNGSGVIEPLFFRYPKDSATYSIDAQFLWGSALLISPSLMQGQVEVRAYFPSDLWYDIYDGSLTSGLQAQWLTLKSPIEKINVHVRGGSIVPMQRPAVTTTIARKGPFNLLVALNETGEAYGSLYWDDGESLDSIEHQKFSYVHFHAMKDILTSRVLYTGYNPLGGLILDTVRCLGVPNRPNAVTIDGQPAVFQYNEDVHELFVTSRLDLLRVFKIEWH